MPACVAFLMRHFTNMDILRPHSLSDNQICGVDKFGKGTFTLDAINALCEALNNSNLTSIKCVAK